jgi:hypothetical protein
VSLRQAQVAREAWIAQHPAEVAWERDLRARIEVVARPGQDRGDDYAWTATGDAFGRAIATPGAARPRDRSGPEATATRSGPTAGAESATRGSGAGAVRRASAGRQLVTVVPFSPRQASIRRRSCDVPGTRASRLPTSTMDTSSPRPIATLRPSSTRSAPAGSMDGGP